MFIHHQRPLDRFCSDVCSFAASFFVVFFFLLLSSVPHAKMRHARLEPLLCFCPPPSAGVAAVSLIRPFSARRYDARPSLQLRRCARFLLRADRIPGGSGTAALSVRLWSHVRSCSFRLSGLFALRLIVCVNHFMGPCLSSFPPLLRADTSGRRVAVINQFMANIRAVPVIRVLLANSTSVYTVSRTRIQQKSVTSAQEPPLPFE